MTTIRLPVTLWNGDRAAQYEIELDPAQILGDLPARIETVRTSTDEMIIAIGQRLAALEQESHSHPDIPKALIRLGARIAAMDARLSQPVQQEDAKPDVKTVNCDKCGAAVLQSVNGGPWTFLMDGVRLSGTKGETRCPKCQHDAKPCDDSMRRVTEALQAKGVLFPAEPAKPDADEAAAAVAVEALASVVWSESDHPAAVKHFRLGIFGARAVLAAFRRGDIPGASTPMLDAFRRENAEAQANGLRLSGQCQEALDARDKALAELAAVQDDLLHNGTKMNELRANLAAATERAEKAEHRIKLFKDECIFVHKERDAANASTRTAVAERDAARADADACADVVGRVIEWAEVPGNRIAPTILDDGRTALAAHDAARKERK